MNVDYIRPAIPQNRFNFPMPRTGPDTIGRRLNLADQAAGVGRLLFYFLNVEAIFRQELRFRFENLVFASRLDVAVVHAQHAETSRLDGNWKSERSHG